MIEKESFGHGYVMSTTGTAHTATKQWKALVVAHATYRCHERTAVHHRGDVTAEGDGNATRSAVVIIGQPVDLEHATADGGEIAARVLAKARTGDDDAVVRYVAYLGGRFTCFVHRDATIRVIPDCHATQSVYWRMTPSGFVASSHVELVGGDGQAEPDQHALLMFRQLVDIRQAAGTKYLPGVVTAYEGVRPVMPNCTLNVDIGSGTAQHQRFYPFAELPRHSIDAAYALFEDLFRNHVRLLSSLGRVGISVTAGLDSRVTLASGREYFSPDSFAFTYYRAGNTAEAHVRDMYEGNRLAWEYGLWHRVVRWDSPDDAPEFRDIFKNTFPHLPQARKIASAFYSQLPRNFYQLQSNIAETGTAFYRRRNVEEASPRRLAHLWQGAEVSKVPAFADAFEDFISFSDFHRDALGDLDYHDAFYWEHRMARWAANRYHEADLAHRVVLPFNQRGIIEAMMSIPLEARTEKVLLHRVLDRFPPLADSMTPAGRSTPYE